MTMRNSAPGVLSEFGKIPRYLAEGFLVEINGRPTYPLTY
jgi:hypothetical protein